MARPSPSAVVRSSANTDTRVIDAITRRTKQGPETDDAPTASGSAAATIDP